MDIPHHDQCISGADSTNSKITQHFFQTDDVHTFLSQCQTVFPPTATGFPTNTILIQPGNLKERWITTEATLTHIKTLLTITISLAVAPLRKFKGSCIRCTILCNELAFNLTKQFSYTHVARGVAAVIVPCTGVTIVEACTDRHDCRQSDNNSSNGETHFFYEVIRICEEDW